MPPTMGLDAGNPATRKMREILLRHPEIITVVSQHGRPDNGSDASPFSNVELFVPLKPYEQWRERLHQGHADRRARSMNSPTRCPASTSTSRNISRTTSRRRSPASKAPTRSRSSAATWRPWNISPTRVMHADGSRSAASPISGIFHVLGQPNLNIKVDREKAARYGLNTGDVNTVIQAAMGGAQATTLLEADRQFNLAVRLPPNIAQASKPSATSKSASQRRAATNAYIPLRELADYHPRYRRLLYLSRGQRALHSGQVQRPRSRSRRHRRRGAGAHRQERQAAERLSHRLGRRVRGSAARQSASRDHRADQPAADPGAALRRCSIRCATACWRWPAFRSRSAAACSRSILPD